MMKAAAGIRTAFTIGASLSPSITIRAASAAFRRVGPPAHVRPEHRATHERARVERIATGGGDVVTYIWPGASNRTVLFAHGWQSRASRFAPLIDDLASSGYTLVSFDAPANGDSHGRSVTILDYIAAISAMNERHGPFAAIVGHSLGALAGAVAINEGVTAERFVSIAAVTRFRSVVESFSDIISLPTALREPLAGQIARTLFPTEPEPFARFDMTNGSILPTVPSLVVHDRDDRYAPCTEGEEFASWHPDASFLLTEGLGHNRDLTRSEVRDAIRRFILAAQSAPTADVAA